MCEGETAEKGKLETAVRGSESVREKGFQNRSTGTADSDFEYRSYYSGSGWASCFIQNSQKYSGKKAGKGVSDGYL